MKTKPSNYHAHVQFEAVSIHVTAKNKIDAIQKIKKKVSEMNLVKLIDKNNFWVDKE